MPKKILYIANVRLPTEKAHGVQIMEMCHAFASLGNDVELVVPRRKNQITKETFSFYDLPKNFLVTRLFTWDLIQFGQIAFLVQSLTFTLSAFLFMLGRNALIYSRDDLFLFFMSFTGKQYVYEIHAPKWHFVTRRALARASLVVSISQGLKDFYLQKGIPEERILVAPDGVNLERFAVPDSKEECRRKLGLPLEQKIALYSGHLYERKGAHTFAEAAKLLGDGTLCVFVGGTDEDIVEFKKRYDTVQNIRILGYRPHQDIPYYLKAADVLILPNSAKDADSRLYTSPMKLFEYMASRTPIVAAEVPSLREMLTDDCAFFFKPDDPSALATAVMKSIEDPSLSLHYGEEAGRIVQVYSWEQRGENICSNCP